MTPLYVPLIATHYNRTAIILVGIGRPFLYAFSTYGAEGVDKALQILNVSGIDDLMTSVRFWER